MISITKYFDSLGGSSKTKIKSQDEIFGKVQSLNQIRLALQNAKSVYIKKLYNNW